MTDKFDKPTNEWIEEDVEIPMMTPKVNPEKGRVEFTQSNKKAKRRTFYSDSPNKKMVCPEGSHVFYCIDKGKYIFKCKNCDWHKIAFPVTYKFNKETGELIHRVTNKRV